MGDRKVDPILILFTTLSLFGLSSGTDFAFGEFDCEEYIEFRTIDGTCNNLDEDKYDWGSANIPLLRPAGQEYDDGFGTPSGDSRPSPREISNIISDQPYELLILNSDHASDYIWQWGQFLDHDISLTPSGSEFFPIPVPEDDDDFESEIIPFTRSIYTVDEGVRQQINKITAYIDASNVYGSEEMIASDLIDPTDARKLKTSAGNLLPENEDGFVAGDVRAMEQIGLTAMHTLFVREHNRLAEEISEKHPDFEPEEVFQTARKVVGAKMQVITYNEYLPYLLGPNALPNYSGYNPSVNSGIANEFSTASYRYGHSQLSPNLLIVDESENYFVPLRQAFFNPEKFKEVGLEGILKGLASQKAQQIDTLVVDDVRNFLFGDPSLGGLDLASLNIQRGRDHGIPNYNAVRIAYGLEPVTDFDQISSDPDIQTKLSNLYVDVDDIDLWVGGLAEDHVPNAMVGETIREVLIDQFSRLRDGDRFWYQNDPFFQDNKGHMKEIEKTKLSDVIKMNTNIESIQENVFKYNNAK